MSNKLTPEQLAEISKDAEFLSRNGDTRIGMGEPGEHLWMCREAIPALLAHIAAVEAERDALKDPRPLSELTPDEWVELGFTWDDVKSHKFATWGTSNHNWIHWCSDHGCVINGRSVKGITTVGQLRCLMLALGDT